MENTSIQIDTYQIDTYYDWPEEPGQDVLVNGHRPAGKHTVKYDASHLSSGFYLYRIRTEAYTAAKVMTLHR